MTERTALIETSGKTRAQICKEAGVSQPFLSLWENGERQVGVGKVSALAAALGVEPAALRPDLAVIFTPSQQPEGAE